MDQHLILHHYPMSPFAEKVRLALAFKGMAYKSVRIPSVMPKPDVVALTGGHRRTPLLQQGNHVYVDTKLILQRLEQLHPDPTLYKYPAAEPLAHWADTVLFEIVAGLISRPTRLDYMLAHSTEDELKRFAADRKAMRDDATRLTTGYRLARSQLPAYLAWLEGMLVDRDYVLGNSLCAADLSVYACLWLAEVLVPEQLPEDGPLPGFMKRIAAVGPGTQSALTSEEAIDVCRSAPTSACEVAPIPAGREDIAVGDQIVVRATDYARDPVQGELAAVGLEELVVRREDPRAGEVFVHFPRIGFEFRKLAG